MGSVWVWPGVIPLSGIYCMFSNQRDFSAEGGYSNIVTEKKSKPF
jgi:hypothetical protein